MPIDVHTDLRVLRAGALLAASSWPAREQRERAYQPHRVALAAQRAFAGEMGRPEVVAADAAAAVDLQAFWHDVLSGEPAELPGLGDFIDQHRADLAAAETALEAVLAERDLTFLLMQLFARPMLLAATPNLLYPGRTAIGVATAVDVVAVVPPPIAWGSSTPWRYDERPDETLAAVAQAFGSALVADGALATVGAPIAAADVGAVPAAVAVLALHEYEGQAAAAQYQVLAKRTLGLTGLPAVVGALQEWLGSR